MSTLELEKTEEIAKLDLGELKLKRKYVKKPKPEVIHQEQLPDVAEAKISEPKEKKPRSEAQQKAFEKCLESKKVKTALRKEEKAHQLSELTEEQLIKAEEKLVKTGIKLQKKALIKLAIEEGDDIDISDELVKKVLKRRAQKKPSAPVPPPPQMTPPQSPSRKYAFIDN
jgi:hypothetical protein